jgi:hypothetical protein
VIIIEALFFVLSSGLLFSKRFRSNTLLVVLVGLVALAASFFLGEQIWVRWIAPRPDLPPRANPYGVQKDALARVNAIARGIKLIEELYVPYYRPDHHTPAFFDAVPWSQDAGRLVRGAVECQKRKNEEVFNYDPIVSAQDWNLSPVVVTVEKEPENRRMTLIAMFQNGGQPTSVHYDLVEEEGNWRVDNIRGIDDGGVRQVIQDSAKHC